MSRNLVLWLVGLVALALLGLWRLSVERTGRERSDSETVASADGGEGRRYIDLVLPPSGETPDPSPALQSAPSDEPRAKRAATVAAAESISGRVVLPEGFVPSEKVWIMLRRGSDWISSGVAMEPDGIFRLSVPAGMETVALAVSSRFLWLPREVLARRGQWDVELRPMAFGVIEGVVVPPASFATVGATWDDLKLEWDLGRTASLSPEECRTPFWPHECSPGDDGAFEFAWVTAGATILLHAENPFGPDWLKELAPLAPGEVRKVEIALERGIRVAGSVVDEHGEPVAGVRLALGAERPVGSSWDHWSEPDPTTDSEGRFLLTKVPAGVWLVRTDDLDLLQQGKADFDATKGDVIDLVIQVVRGGSIEGEVRWPDGTPVDDFEVEVTDPIRKIEDGDGGRFRLLGLSEGRYRLEVRAVRAGFTGQVEVPGVEPNRAPLDLILQEAPDCKLSGLVVDGSDEPVGKFSVRAYREEGPGSASVDGIAGQFRLSGLTPGAWILYVHAEGCQEVEQRVDVEAESNSELRIVLLSAGRIRGRVLDSRNTPVAGAWVGEDHMAFTIKFFGPRDQATDSLGAFDIEVQSTHLLLVAIANGYASSEVLALEIEPGQTLENVELHLRDACRVEGRVLDEHGAPVGAVHVFAPEFESLGINTETDARGAFALEGLPAGRTKVVAWHEDRPGALASAWITLAPGPPVSLELRFQAPDPVRLHGRVSRGGSSLASALGMRTASFFLDFTSSTDGRFEATLQQPGEWLGFVRGMDEEPSTDLREMDLRRFTVVVPDLEEYELVLDFDTLARVISPEELWR